MEQGEEGKERVEKFEEGWESFLQVFAGEMEKEGGLRVHDGVLGLMVDMGTQVSRLAPSPTLSSFLASSRVRVRSELVDCLLMRSRSLLFAVVHPQTRNLDPSTQRQGSSPRSLLLPDVAQTTRAPSRGEGCVEESGAGEMEGSFSRKGTKSKYLHQTSILSAASPLEFE